jgi:hypothetical protein
MQYRAEHSNRSQFHPNGWSVGLSRVSFGAEYRWIKCLVQKFKAQLYFLRSSIFSKPNPPFSLFSKSIISSAAIHNNQQTAAVLSRDFIFEMRKVHRKHFKILQIQSSYVGECYESQKSHIGDISLRSLHDDELGYPPLWLCHTKKEKLNQ